MKFDQPLIEGRLLRRYKRFLADVELSDGEIITAHTANTGAMTGCCAPGSRVWLSRSENPKRKYPLTWELVEVATGVSCGINTLLSNKLVRESIESGVISELQGYEIVRNEVSYGNENSRIDLLLECNTSQDLLSQGRLQGKPPCYVEVKNVTLVEQGTGFFPDAVTKRGTKHLRELMAVARQGYRTVIFFCVQRNDCDEVRPAESIDPVYSETLQEAIKTGVETLAYRFDVSSSEIKLGKRLPVVLK